MTEDDILNGKAYIAYSRMGCCAGWDIDMELQSRPHGHLKYLVGNCAIVMSLAVPSKAIGYAYIHQCRDVLVSILPGKIVTHMTDNMRKVVRREPLLPSTSVYDDGVAIDFGEVVESLHPHLPIFALSSRSLRV